MKKNMLHMTFRNDYQSIRMYYVRKPMEHGVAGLLVSPLFQKNIGLFIDGTPEGEREYDFACLSKCSGINLPIILMERETFFGILRGNDFARTTLLHETGHYVHEDMNAPSFSMDSYNEERYNAAKESKATENELNADRFASSFIGTEKVISGLKQLEDLINAKYPDGECRDIAVQEIETRISMLQKEQTYK